LKSEEKREERRKKREERRKEKEKRRVVFVGWALPTIPKFHEL
jgi:hypothetical protein